MVVWIIGLSGSGKTFFAKKIFENYKNKKKIITIDGDEVRKYITYRLKYNMTVYCLYQHDLLIDVIVTNQTY